MKKQNNTAKASTCSTARQSTRTSWPLILAVFAWMVLYGAVLHPQTAAAAPLVSAVTPSASLQEADTGIIIDGSGFSSTPTVFLTKLNDWNNPGAKVEQVLTNTPGDTSIEFTVTTCGLSFYPIPSPWEVYLWVVDSSGVVGATGFPVQLDLVKDNTSPGAASFDDGHTSPDVYPPAGHISGDIDAAYPTLPTVFDMQAKFYELSLMGPAQCYYSLNDGANWIFIGESNVLTTGAIYCIKKYITAPDGPVAIKARACSPCGGCGDTITKNRLVDGTGPETGLSFTAVPGADSCTVSWSTTTDAGIGMHDTDPYKVYTQADSALTVDPPGSCSGFNIYSGTGTETIRSSQKVGHDYYFKLCYQDAYGNISSYSGNPVQCVLPGIILSSGAIIANKVVKGADQDVAVDTFILSTNMASARVTELVVNSLILPANTSNISAVKLFRDNGTIADALDPGDTFIASSTFVDTDATFSGLDIPVSTTPAQFFITYSIVAAPEDGAALRGYVKSLVGDLAYSGSSVSATTLTVDAVAPITTDNTPADWLNNEITITFNSTSGPVNQSTGYYGCLGSGCTPAVLGSNTITTNCGAGNVCTYDVRYYSVDTAGNTEAIKTAANQAMVDRSAPQGGIFTAVSNTSPIVLSWSGITDTGSGLKISSPYQIRRATGSTPPPDCASGTYRYSGSASTFTDNDASLINGMTYSYLLCVYDEAGNTATDHTVSAVYRKPCTSSLNCQTCHETPPMTGSHPQHGGGECDSCHREGFYPSHVDGLISLTMTSGSTMPDVPWPGGGVSCGGTWSPVGGDPGGGVTGCHMGSAVNPALTPEWECIWNPPICNPPPGP